jgi:fucose permease
MVGRFAVGLLPLVWSNRGWVRRGLVVAVLGGLLFATDAFPAWLSLTGLVLLGLGCAPVYPSLMHETTRRFGPDMARRVVGRQVAFACAGAALGPAALGLLGAAFGPGAIMPAVLLALGLLALLCACLDRVT